MKILNKTQWDTNDIHKLVTAVARDEMTTPEYRKRLLVKVAYKRRGAHTLGWGYYDYAEIWLRLERDEIDLVSLACTIAHEIQHNHNIKHRNMRNVIYGRRPGWRDHWAWAAQYTIRKNEPKAKPTAEDKNAAKLAKAEGKLTEWQRKQKAAANKVRAWRRKVKYFDRRRAALIEPKGD